MIPDRPAAAAPPLQGDQYDVREKGGERDVRNLGLPVELAARYFREGADEVTFLNITGFRDFPLGDLPMLQVRGRAWCRGRAEGCAGEGRGHCCRQGTLCWIGYMC